MSAYAHVLQSTRNSTVEVATHTAFSSMVPAIRGADFGGQARSLSQFDETYYSRSDAWISR